MSIPRDRLFRRQFLDEHLEEERAKVEAAARDISSERLREESIDKLVEEVVENYQYRIPELADEDEWRIADHGEALVTVKNHMLDKMVEVDGYYFTFAVPYTGDIGLLAYQPKSYKTNPPDAQNISKPARSRELHFRYEAREAEANFKSHLEKQIGLIKHELGSMKDQIESHNQGIRRVAKKTLEKRKSGLEGLDSAASDMGLPID